MKLVNQLAKCLIVVMLTLIFFLRHTVHDLVTRDLLGAGPFLLWELINAAESDISMSSPIGERE